MTPTVRPHPQPVRLLCLLPALLLATPALAADPAPVALPAAEVAPQSTPAIRVGTGKKGRDPVAMVTVAAGPFLMGCNEAVDSECLDDERPGHTVVVKAFKIDRTEVTVRQFARCVAAGACSSAGLTMPFYGGKDQPERAAYCNWQQKGREQHPINCVSWQQATAYCAWVGKRLPTEAEWEKAARGTDGRKYPWGNTGYASAGKVANVADASAHRQLPDLSTAGGYDDGYVGTAPVGSMPKGAAPSGALDMIGNVWEWTADSRDGGRVVRGSSWTFDPRLARVSLRGHSDPAVRAADGGFRCAR
jgi:formylglycine-generating enzyme required for sulfatase activity